MGDLQDAIEQMGPDDAARARADALAGVPRPVPWSAGAVSITVTGGPRRFGDYAVEVDISVTVNGVPVPLNNPFRFVNPPIRAFNGTYHEREMGDGRDSRIVLIPNEAEGLEESLRLIIQGTALAILRGRGLVV